MNSGKLAREWFESVWGRRDPDAIARLMHPDAGGLTESGEIRGPEAFRTEVYDTLIEAFPDIEIDIDGIIAEGDEAVVRWTLRATHSGRFLDLPVSGRRLRCSGMTWLRFAAGRITEGADRYNLHALVGFLATGEESATVRDGSKAAPANPSGHQAPG
jgi:steroid delta-isomerase-like uncharacterized protein